VLIQERNEKGRYLNLYDVCERMDTRSVNKRVMESLIKVGAFDSLHTNRKALFEVLDRAFDRAHRLSRNKAQNQQTLFATFEKDETFREETTGYPDVPDWSMTDRLSFEKDLTGYWISSHPVSEQSGTLGDIASHTTTTMSQQATGSPVAIAAVVLDKRVFRTKAGKTMAVLSLEDQYGRFEGVLFPGNQSRRGEVMPGPFDKFAHDCEPDLVALFCGTVDRRQKNQSRPTMGGAGTASDGELPGEDLTVDNESTPEELPSLRINDVIPASLVVERLTREVVVNIDGSQLEAPQDVEQRLKDCETALKEHPGARPLTVLVHTKQDVLLTLALGENWRIHPCHELLEKLRSIWGRDQVRVISAGLEELQTHEQRGPYARSS
jgi:DNA polymerase III alpha subunit